MSPVALGKSMNGALGVCCNDVALFLGVDSRYLPGSNWQNATNNHTSTYAPAFQTSSRNSCGVWYRCTLYSSPSVFRKRGCSKPLSS